MNRPPESWHAVRIMIESKTQPLSITITDGAPDQAVTRLLDHAAGAGISDVFFTTNENHVAVLGRHFGILRQLSMLSPDMGRRCIAHVKALAGMDVAEHRRPQDGRWVNRQ